MLEEMSEESKKKTGLAAFKESLETLPENKKYLANKLFKNIQFMDKTLKELQEKIKNEGAVITTTNGNGFEVLTENPAQKSYNIMIGKYNAAVKTMLDLLPAGVGEDDPLMGFLKNR